MIHIIKSTAEIVKAAMIDEDIHYDKNESIHSDTVARCRAYVGRDGLLAPGNV